MFAFIKRVYKIICHRKEKRVMTFRALALSSELKSNFMVAKLPDQAPQFLEIIGNVLETYWA